MSYLQTLLNPPSPPPPVLINWQGISGTVYQFQLHPVGTPYLARSGVYIFCKLAPNGNWDAVYIGETDNFNRRLTEQFTLHHRWSCIRAAGATHICTLHVPGDLALREGIETDLRRLIQAPCNLQ